ncbi:iron ABC transporter permease [Paracoccus sp. MC1862]|uniref:ABC transporter permease n=1 Tax=Paracoccus sp. MC1862 TaxID=2760307 RepID=UPI0015FF5541|nr:iron ABC transporter permease [Paracoccus sp. MC1862]MBB1498565.1 iron ABC transporter permease [Paracoccus sp. MC1862]QQO44180.1 iron ABC transporter permease [Paracoccus sp. MC1862]
MALVACFVLVTGLWPLIRLFALALGPGETGEPLGLLRETLSGRAFGRALGNTLASSGGSVVISAALGTALALATGLLRLPGQALLGFLALSPLLIPSQIMALAWIELMGSGSAVLGALGLAPAPGSRNPLYSGAGVAWLMGIEHMPLVFIAVRARLAGLPLDLIEAARIGGAGPARILRRIVLPLTLPSVAAGSVLAFAAAVGNFGVPALLGIPGRFPVLTTLIYQRLNGFGPGVIGSVAAMALVLVALAAAALILRQLVLRWTAVPVPAGRSFTGFERGRWHWPLTAAVWAVLVALSVLPIVALATTALVPALGVPFGLGTATLRNFEAVLANPAIRRAFANSFMLAGAAGLVSAVVALPIAWLSLTARNPLARVLSWLAEPAHVVPGTVLALAMILAYLRPLPLLGVSIYSTGAILLIAYLGRFLPLALRPVEAALSASDPALDEAARIHGVPPLRRMLGIAVPAALPAMAAGALVIFMTAINELTLSALLWSAGNETIGVQIFSLQYEGNSTAAAALSVLALAAVAMLVMAADRLGRRLPPGALPWRVAQDQPGRTTSPR